MQRVANKCVAHVRGQLARKSHVAVRRDQRELDGVRQLLCGPQLLVEPVRPSVQRVAIVVCRHRVLMAIQRELAVADAVAIAADDRAKVSLLVLLRLVYIAFYGVVTEHDIGHLAVAVLRVDRHDARAVIGDLHLEIGIFECVDLGGLAIRQLAEVGLHYSYRSSCALCSGHHHHG